MTHRARTVGWDVSILMFFICVAGKKSQPFVASVRVAPHQEEPCCWGWTGWQGGDKHALARLFCLEPFSGRTTPGQSTRFTKEMMPFLFSLCRGGCVTERVVTHSDDIYFASKTRCSGSDRSRVVG